MERAVPGMFIRMFGSADAPLSVLWDMLLIVFSLLFSVALGVTGILRAAPIADVPAIIVTVAVMLRIWKELGQENKAQGSVVSIMPSNQWWLSRLPRNMAQPGRRLDR